MDELTRQRLSANWNASCGKLPMRLWPAVVIRQRSRSLASPSTSTRTARGRCWKPDALSWARVDRNRFGRKPSSPGLDHGVKWHMIGHLQTNKVRRLLRHQPIIHSVDSQRLLDCIVQESVAQGLTTQVLLEVNISGDPSKTGLTPEAAEQTARAIARLGRGDRRSDGDGRMGNRR